MKVEVFVAETVLRQLVVFLEPFVLVAFVLVAFVLMAFVLVASDQSLM